MSRFLKRVAECARLYPTRIAFENSQSERLTYSELVRISACLARYLVRNNPSCLPVVVYGHKSPLMLCAFFACMRSRCAYVPVDVIYPQQRIDDILSQLDGSLVIDTLGDNESFFELNHEVIGRTQLESLLVKDSTKETSSEPLFFVEGSVGSDVMYILFTSGSTGAPKGVQMSTACIDSFMDYFIDLMGVSQAVDQNVFFNRVPYTFDVSLFDMVPGLATASRLYALETAQEQSLRHTFKALEDSGLTHWVSTPSYIEACLADPAFDQHLLPHLSVIVLCGEVLRNTVAHQIIDRFPYVKLYNTYGPTETQSVTDIVVDRDLLEECDPLPVGYVSTGMHAFIRDPETGTAMSCGQVGEIYLAGNTVSLGYYGQPERTASAFSTIELNGESLRCYRTGDKGYLDEKNRLFCLGRFDFQVKVNGFRVELGDVEENLCTLPSVQQACVVPVVKNGAVAYLCAFLCLTDKDAPHTYSQTRAVKKACKEILPSYMIPRVFRYVDKFPLNSNGKIDRKTLQTMAGERA